MKVHLLALLASLWPLIAIVAGILMSIGRGITIRFVWIVCAFSVSYAFDAFGKKALPSVGTNVLTNVSLGATCLGIGMVIALMIHVLRR